MEDNSSTPATRTPQASTNLKRTNQAVTANNPGAAALWYAARKIPVLPLHGVDDAGRCSCDGAPRCKPGKHPRLSNGHNGATTDPDQIRRWWRRWPNANIGIATGERSGLLVLDVDTDEDADGFASLAALEGEHGPLPQTLTVVTGGGGRHVYLKYPTGCGIRISAGKVGRGLDVRGEGGYVVAPPSRTHKGPYKVINTKAPAEPPAWLLEAARAPHSAPEGNTHEDRPRVVSATLDGDPIPEGRRNDELTRIAGSLRARGLEREELEEELLAVNAARCSPPLEAAEVAAIARSVCRYPAGNASPAPPPEVLETVEALNLWWWAEKFPKVGGKTMASFLRMLMREGRRIGTVIPGVGLRVSLSVRAAAELVGCHRNTIENMTRKGRAAGILRKDGAGHGKAAAFVLLDPRQTCDTRTMGFLGGGVSQPSRALVAELRTAHYRWRGPVGKGRERALCALEAFGGQTAEELADRLGWARARDLRARYLEPLRELGLVEEGGGVWSLADTGADARDVPYSTVQHRVRRVWSPTEERRVYVVAESGTVASDAEREQRDRERHERERWAFRNRHVAGLDLHPANGNADGFISELEPADASEPELSSLAAAMKVYLERNPHDAKQPLGWLGLTLWAHDFYEGKPTLEESRAALEELRAKRRSAA